MTDTDAHHRTIRSFVRREGRITRSQQRALDELWPAYGVEYTGNALDFATLFGRSAPVVLEIGFGSGLNLPHYLPEKVRRIFALEPSPGMRRKAGPNVEASGLDVEFIDLPGEHIPLDNDSVDTVLVTYTLCTIADAAAALEGMRRVLKPGGQLIFCEHGIAPDEEIRRWRRQASIPSPAGGPRSSWTRSHRASNPPIAHATASQSRLGANANAASPTALRQLQSTMARRAPRRSVSPFLIHARLPGNTAGSGESRYSPGSAMAWSIAVNS